MPPAWKASSGNPNTRFNPTPISIHSIGKPAAGTKRASMPRRVPINCAECPRARSSRATASAGITWPPLPPPAMTNVATLNLHVR